MCIMWITSPNVDDSRRAEHVRVMIRIAEVESVGASVAPGV